MFLILYVDIFSVLFECFKLNCTNLAQNVLLVDFCKLVAVCLMPRFMGHHLKKYYLFYNSAFFELIYNEICPIYIQGWPKKKKTAPLDKVL